MNRLPTGRLERRDDDTADLVYSRTVRRSRDDVWRTLTHPDQTARWYGRWDGDGRVGGTITVTTTREDTAGTEQASVVACEAPTSLSLRLGGDDGWLLHARLEDGPDEATLLHFTHVDVDPLAVGELGPGWDYYLDLLTATLEEQPDPAWSDFYPAGRAYYGAAARAYDPALAATYPETIDPLEV